MTFNKDYAIYCPPADGMSNSDVAQRVIIPQGIMSRKYTNEGVVIEFKFKLKKLPQSRAATLLGCFNVLGGNTSEEWYSIKVNTSNEVMFVFRRVPTGLSYLKSQALEVDKWYHVIINYNSTNVQMWVNDYFTTFVATVLDTGTYDIISVLSDNYGGGISDNYNGWFKDFRVFKGVGEITLPIQKVLHNNGSGKYISNESLPALLKDKSIIDIRFAQENGDTVYNEAINHPKHIDRNYPIAFDNKFKGVSGAGTWERVEFEEEVVIDDFEPIYQLAMVNAVPENWQTREEADVLKLDYVYEPTNYRFAATTTNGSWIKSDIPLESRIAGDIVFSTTDGNGANVLSLVDGQNDGIAFWFSSLGNFRFSIFHGGGTQEQFNFSSSIPYDETDVNVRFLIYNNAGTQAIKIWSRVGGVETLEVNSTSTNLIDGFLYQLGQFKNTTSNRLNGSSPTATEGIKSCVIWRVNKATQPSDAEVLALVQPEVPEFQINRYELSGVANVAGMVRYNPLFFDESGATKYPVMMWFHGSGDGRNNFSLTRIALITIMVWLRQNNVEFIVLAFQSTTGGWEGGRINDCCDYSLNETTGLLKDYVDYSNTLLDVCLAGYSAGANGLDYFMSNGSAYLAKIKCIVPIAGVLNDAVSHVATLASNGNYIMVFCVTNDPISGTTTSKNLIEDLQAVDASRGSIVEFSDFLAGDSHTAIQDLTYNNTGNVEPQQSGSYGTTGVYRVWLDTTWWNDVRTVLETGTL